MSETIARPNRKLLAPYFLDAEYQRRDMIARPEPGTTLAEMEVPAYWGNVAAVLRPLDRIEVRPADGSWWAELLVRVVEPQSVKVYVLRHVEFDRPMATTSLVETEAPEGYEYRHRGPARQWAVMRLADNTCLIEKHPSREAAAAWLSAHLRKLAT